MNKTEFLSSSYGNYAKILVCSFGYLEREYGYTLTVSAINNEIIATYVNENDEIRIEFNIPAPPIIFKTFDIDGKIRKKKLFAKSPEILKFSSMFFNTLGDDIDDWLFNLKKGKFDAILNKLLNQYASKLRRELGLE